jgi:hypothetical protein
VSVRIWQRDSSMIRFDQEPIMRSPVGGPACHHQD